MILEIAKLNDHQVNFINGLNDDSRKKILVEFNNLFDIIYTLVNKYRRFITFKLRLF